MDDFSLRPRDYLVPCGGVVFPNPNAPTGRALGLEEVLSVVEYQESRSTVVLVDEAYVDFGAQSARSAVNRYPNLLTIHTLSKASSLAGLRVGYAIGQEELIEGLRRVKDSFNSYTLDRLALAGAEAALSDASYYDEVNRRLALTRDRTAEALERMGFTVVPSLSNFLFVRHPDREGAELFQLLRDRGVLVRYFKKERIDQYLRISVGTDEEMDTLLRICGELA
jgi:histidinol-phosphate aminotransferase